MTESKALGFQDLFGAAWSGFKSNYGAILGFGILGIIIASVWFFLINIVGGSLAASAEDGALAPRLVAFALQLFISVFIVLPVYAYIGYAILRRVRGSSEPRKAGKYGGIVLLAIFQTVFFLPGQFLMVLGNPGQFSNLINTYEGLEKLNEDAHSEHASTAEATAEVREDQREFKAGQLPMHNGLLFGGSILMLLGGLLLLLWIPWANLALLDPRNESTSAGQALQYGSALTAPTRGPMYGAWIVMCLIGVGSFCLFCLPGIFFGMPLLLAAGPGFYMAMRGEGG